MPNRIYSFLGLAQKAGKLLSGDETCERAVKQDRVNLILVAEDASDNTKKKFKDICQYRNIDIVFFGEKKQLGKHIGKDESSVLAVTDVGFSKRIKELVGIYAQQNGGEHIVKN